MVYNPWSLGTEQQLTDPVWMDTATGMAVFNHVPLFLGALM